MELETSRTWRRMWRVTGATALCAALAACGGGGDDDAMVEVEAPPASAAKLANTGDDAVAAAQAAVTAAARVAQVQDSMGLADFFPFFDSGYGAASRSKAARVGIASTDTVRARNSDSASCYELFGITPCEGRVRIDASFDVNGDVFPSTGSATLSFERIDVDRGALMIDGRIGMRWEDWNYDSYSWAGASIVVSFDAVKASYSGAVVGPFSGAARLDYTDDGVTTTMGGVRFADLEYGWLEGAGTYLESGSVRIAHPAQAGRYVDVAYDGWVMRDGVPRDGAATVSAGSGPILVVSVQSSTATRVEYQVEVRQQGSAGATYRITADYGDGGPSYRLSTD